MDALERIQWDLARLALGQQVTFCAFCAERVTPIIEALAPADLRQLWGTCLGLLWFRTDHESSGGDDPASLLKTLGARPEAHFGDSHYCEYYVMRALSIICYSLNVLVDSVPSQYVRWVSDGMYSFAADFDFAIPSKRRADVLKSADSLKFSEETIQRTLVLELQQASISPGFADRKRQEAKGWADTFRKLLPDYCQVHGWPLLSGTKF